jgi:hypothetical protein
MYFYFKDSHNTELRDPTLLSPSHILAQLNFGIIDNSERRQIWHILGLEQDQVSTSHPLPLPLLHFLYRKSNAVAKTYFIWTLICDVMLRFESDFIYNENKLINYGCILLSHRPQRYFIQQQIFCNNM